MYKQLFIPGHPRVDVTGLVPEHIVIAEGILGRPLERGELVHHKDFDKLNNSVDNLLVPISRAQHQKLPEYQARFIIAKGLYSEFLEWWNQAQLEDVANQKLQKLELALVKAENERQRFLCKLAKQEVNND